jgi:hypothetical protein
LPLNIISFSKPEILSNVEDAITFLPCFFMPVYVTMHSLYFYVDDIKVFYRELRRCIVRK